MESRIYNTQELIKILEEERQACLQGKRFNLAAISPTGNPVIDYFMKKSLGVQQFSAYQDFKAAIHLYQQEYEVSGIIWQKLTDQGDELSYPIIHDQLIALKSDLEILREAKSRVIQFWQKMTEGRDLYLSLNRAHQYQRVNTEEVSAIVQRTEWANLWKWERDNFLEILLQLGWGQPQEASYKRGWPTSGSEYIHAVNPGQFPIVS